ncbi:hypothetical protein F4560_001746 [Saccharothrix ecbatanensis]|uniref:Uncharacterized protein n=1 Tax=Saccharothrix ecbatanensis TaxID=1105145 RepID=A0A7W9HGR6_9PSEU|nr:DUF6544 family protein [Saccharothrix ecbatanensis]MBB5801978.1 hypothetical protein [Saccharothrix ecbatanensis]
MTSTIHTGPITADDIAHLPEPAQRYLRLARVPGRPADVSFHATTHGFFRMHLKLAHVVPVRAEDVYENRHGRMHATALGLIPVADGEARS